MIGSPARGPRLFRPNARVVLLTASFLLPLNAEGQNPLRHWTDAIESRFAESQPVIAYTLRVDSADPSGFTVSMRVRAPRDTVTLAMVAHPEYDDRYWRYVRDVRVDGERGAATIARVDSAVWRVVAPGGSFTVHYRLALPVPDDGERAAWRPFIAKTGALIGGAHSFMYVVGATLAPSHVTLDLPEGWSIATALVPTSSRLTYYAPSTAALVESPMLVGKLRDWRFTVDGVPHRIVYWPRPDAVPFDTAALIAGTERLVRETIALFGRAPYREFVFQLQDGAYGALEHPSSVSLGAPSRQLAEGLAPVFGEMSHEYFHVWNLMRIHPIEYGDVTYRTPPRSRGLWFSEGLSMFYSDLLRRRAGLPVGTPTRVAHLEALLNRYYAFPGNARLSAERVSENQYGGDPVMLGDYSASTHLQGELIGTMMDLEIRRATGGRRSMDDVMRVMLARYAGEQGFTSRDVERAIADVCGCNVTRFFDAHVRNGGPIPFDDYLRLVGLEVEVEGLPVLGADGQPVPDLRAYAYDLGDGRGVRLAISDPSSAWGRAGLHTGDRLKTVNDTPIDTPNAMRSILRSVRVGDSLRVTVERGGRSWSANVVMAPFDRRVARLRDVASPTASQRAMRARWDTGQP